MGRIMAGVTARLQGGLVLIILMMIVTGTIGYALFSQLRGDFADITEARLPRLDALADLARESETLVAAAPALAVVPNPVGRRAAWMRIDDRMRAVTAIEDRLADVGLPPAVLTGLRDARANLTANLERIDRLVRDRLNADQDTRRAVRRIIDLDAGITDAGSDLAARLPHDPAGLPAHSRAVTLWAAEARHAVAAMLAGLAAQQSARISAFRRRAHQAIDRMAAAFGKLDDIAGPRLLPLHRQIVASGSGQIVASGDDAPGVFEHRQARITLDGDIQGALGLHRAYSDEFLAIISTLKQSIQNDITHRITAFDSQISEVAHMLIGIGLVALAAGLAYGNANVGRRSRAVQDDRRGGVQNTAPISVSPRDGDDTGQRNRSLHALAGKIQEQEDELNQQRLRAEDTSTAKSNVLAAMTHEILPLMNGVAEMLDLLEHSPLDSNQMQMVGTLKDSAVALIRIIDDILELSEIEAGELGLDLRASSVPLIVEGVAEALLPMARKKDLSLRTYSDPAIPDRVITDPVRLRRILFTLGGTAVTGTSSGRVTLSAELVAPAGAQAAIRFTIADTGTGMPDDTLAGRFEPLTGTEGPTEPDGGGTRPGLSVCKRLVDLMGGDISVSSQVNTGTEVSVRMAVAIAADAARPATGPAGSGTPKFGTTRSATTSPAATVSPLAGLSVLIVNTDQQQGHMLTRYLNAAGVATTVVPTRQDADAALAGRPADLLILCDPQPGTGAADGPGPPRLAIMRDDASRQDTETAGIATLAHPVRRSALYTAVASATGLPGAAPIALAARRTTGGDAADRNTRPVPRLREPAADAPRVLVAEDQPVNQEVARWQLRSLGVHVDVVADGHAALDRLNNRRYAALFTDCHMPGMDGYDLATAIRAREQQTGQRLPIIAITANALSGAGERCRAVGMDDFLAKPVDLKKLRAALQRWVSDIPDTVATAIDPTDSTAPGTMKGGTATGGTNGEMRGADVPPVDPRAIREMFGDDTAQIRDMLLTFFESMDTQRTSFETALAAEATGDIHLAAHALKGIALTIGADALADAAQAVEKAAKAGNWNGINATLPVFSSEIDRVSAYASAFRADAQAAQ